MNTFFVVHTDAGRIDEVMPAYSAQLFIFLRGTGAMQYADGKKALAAPAFFNAPLLRAAPFSLEGPVCCAGVSLTPLGWASWTNLPADQTHDRIVAAQEALAPEAAVRLLALAATDPGDVLTVFDSVADLMRETCRDIRPAHEAMIAETTAWLASAFNPEIDDLYQRLPMSQRQAQRLCRRFFGAPPLQLLKRFRAVRAAALLSQKNLPDAARDEVMAAYFDQAHLIRDLRRYTGRTPRLLQDGPLVAGTLDPAGHGPAATALREWLAPE
ncbi:helix-turn-helix domain-containing protein [Qipengyuania sp. ASV99]|uniref:helix-turn-helix domain-containing protein n=1 Tax=Qipengyuania sp. ASV99 TaxID=3399681 RepID=UPI003A4C6AEC